VTRRRLVRPVVLVPLVAAVLFVATGSGAARGQGSGDPQQGRELFVTGCSSCHGLSGTGVTAPDGSERGPSLEHSGEALAYYMLSTGRMPLGSSEEISRRKEPAYDDRQITDLVAYVGTLGDGPPIPHVDLAAGDLAAGGELYRGNCQACHSATGAGGALSYGQAAPSLSQATPTQVAAAIRTGPGQMPVFGDDTFTDREVDSIAKYVRYLEHPDDRGGLSLGRLGPIPEGFVIWVLGMGLLLVICTWIGGRDRDRRPVDEAAPGEPV
jgi:ubiquinol-cytochrome c reductase cytochrome c subunit